MQILTGNHRTEVRHPNGRVRGRTKGAEGDGNLIGRTRVSINLHSWELPETEPPTKEGANMGLSVAPGTYAADCLVWPQ